MLPNPLQQSASPTLSRRHFLATASALVASTLVPASRAATQPTRFPLIGFIKPFQKLPYTQIAELVAEIGWSGIECPVRKGGTIDPTQVETELPKFHETLRKNKIDVTVIATDVENASDPLSQSVLRTASQLGISRYRLKHYYYDLTKPIPPQLQRFKDQVRELAALNAELRIQGSIQNHSGKNYVGAPVWDIWELIKDQNPQHIAAYFDIGHATLEGGMSWPLHAKLMEPFLSVVSVKDFVWKSTPKQSGKTKSNWKSEWCPLGEGMVRPEFFDTLKKSPFQGPVCQHFEYELGTGKEMVAAMKKELAVLKEWLA